MGEIESRLEEMSTWSIDEFDRVGGLLSKHLITQKELL
jgi:hypothetical protein